MKSIVFKEKPWLRHYYMAQSRCNCKSNDSYKNYGGKGIKFKLTMDEIKKLWFIYDAPSLKKPSIDRIDPDGDYTFGNVRFIEFSENVRNSNKPYLNGRWSKKHEQCIECGRTDSKHVSRGVCHRCDERNRRWKKSMGLEFP